MFGFPPEKGPLSEWSLQAGALALRGSQTRLLRAMFAAADDIVERRTNAPRYEPLTPRPTAALGGSCLHRDHDLILKKRWGA
jgi:hypothetical protein